MHMHILRIQSALVGLEMAAVPKDAAFGYLSAALKENYEFLIVEERLVDNPTFNYYELGIAKIGDAVDGQNHAPLAVCPTAYEFIGFRTN